MDRRSLPVVSFAMKLYLRTWNSWTRNLLLAAEMSVMVEIKRP